MHKFLLLFFIFSFLLACDEPQIDTSSEESMKKSIEEVRNSLSNIKKAEFDEAVQVIALSQINLENMMAGEAGAETTVLKMKEALNGKSADEIIAEANKIQIEREAREKTQALNEIKELEQKKDAAEAAKKRLEKFQIIRSRFYKEKQKYFGDQPIIELTVKNGTNHPVSRAYFIGTLASPGRAIPWLKESFNYKISGGLEPGEEASWTLSPNSFSEWGNVEAPKDAILTVEVEKLDGPNEETLYSIKDFTKYDQERLDELKKKYNE